MKRSVMLMSLVVALTMPVAVLAQSDVSMYRLEWTGGTTVYQALLFADGDSGLMLVKYFDESSQRTAMVAEQFELLTTAAGTILKGLTPIDLATGRRQPHYAADNFILRRYPDGTAKLYNVDDAGAVAEVEASLVRTETELIAALKDYGLYEAFQNNDWLNK